MVRLALFLHIRLQLHLLGPLPQCLPDALRQNGSVPGQQRHLLPQGCSIMIKLAGAILMGLRLVTGQLELELSRTRERNSVHPQEWRFLRHLGRPHLGGGAEVPREL